MNQKSFQFELASRGYLVGGSTDERLEGAWLCFPLMRGFIVETECLATDGQRDITALTRLQEHLLEGFEFLDGTIDAGMLVADIQLDGLTAGTRTGVGHRDGKGEVLRVDRGLAELKCGVAQTVTEGEERL